MHVFNPGENKCLKLEVFFAKLNECIEPKLSKKSTQITDWLVSLPSNVMGISLRKGVIIEFP